MTGDSDPQPLKLRERTITEVIRNPIVIYRVEAHLGDDPEYLGESYDDEASARDAVEMLRSAGAKAISVERVTIRVVQDVEDITEGSET